MANVFPYPVVAARLVSKGYVKMMMTSVSALTVKFATTGHAQTDAPLRIWSVTAQVSVWNAWSTPTAQGNPNGEVCDTSTNTCVQCLTDPDCQTGFVCEDQVCVPLVTIEADIEDPVVNGYASDVASVALSINGEAPFDASDDVTWTGSVGHLEYEYRGEVSGVVLQVVDEAGNDSTEIW